MLSALSLLSFGFVQTGVFLCPNWNLDIGKLTFGAFDKKLSQA
jgi:hypothetical protein